MPGYELPLLSYLGREFRDLLGAKNERGEIKSIELGVTLRVSDSVSLAIGAVVAEQEAGRGKLTNVPADGPLGDAFGATTDGPVRGIDIWFSLVLQEADESP